MTWLGSIGFLYLINRFGLALAFPDITFFKFYGGDVFAIPAFLPFTLYLASKLELIEKSFRLRFSHVLWSIVVFAFIFEIILPRFLTTMTSDFWDIVAYGAGGILCYVAERRGLWRAGYFLPARHNRIN
jgi:branched-subunit amino acid ABC-type transport system permease component